MSEIVFEEIHHLYKLGDEIFPSVTTVLHDLSGIKRLDPAVLAGASERGKDVHLACELFDRGTLDVSTITDEIVPYLEAWTKFRRDWGFEPTTIEMMVYSRRWRFAGTLDRFGFWTVRTRRREVLLDIKSGVPDPTHGPQTAAYLHALREMLPQEMKFPPDRATVYLSARGTYEVVVNDSPADWPLFHAALLVHQFKTTHKVP